MGRWLAVVLVAVLLAAGGTVVVLRQHDGSPCGAELVDSPRSALQAPAAMQDQPNEQRDRLAAAVAAMPAPFGPVAAGLDYYYDQYLHLYGVPGGMLAWTKNNAPVSYLDDGSLKARWSLKPLTKRTAWDTSANRFLLLDLADDGPVTMAQFDLRSGAPRWCVDLGARQRDGQPVATAFLEDGDVVSALPSGSRVRLSRLAGSDGRAHWTRTLGTAARADFLGALTSELVLVGGVEEYRLAQVPPPGPAQAVLTAIDAAHGKSAWTWTGSPGSLTHVVGTDGGQVLLTERTPAGTALVALSSSGTEVWRTPVRDGGYEASWRGDVVVTRSRTGLDGYDARTGAFRWHRPVPADRTYFPYGFTLDQMPSYDEQHVLVPTTTSLELLDLATGTSTSYALPTDGVSTTYWPYQLLVTPEHLGVVTNSGAILAGRE